MEKGKKQKKIAAPASAASQKMNAAPASASPQKKNATPASAPPQKNSAKHVPAPPQKKIKKPQKKKGLAHLFTPSSSMPTGLPSPKTPTLSTPSDSGKKPLTSKNGREGETSGMKGEASGLRGEGAQKRIKGYIFFCNGKTKAECYHHRVFGLPKGKLEEVEKIKKGTKLFLFDYDLKLLYGVYIAVSDGAMNLEPGAFNGSFPAQVKFKVFKDSYPLPEPSLRLAIKDNYNSKGRFNPELGFEQVKNLLSLFQPISTNQSTLPRGGERRARPPHEVHSRNGGMAYVSARADLRYVPSTTHVQNDPYTSAAHVARGPPIMEPSYVPAVRLPPGTGAHYLSADGLPSPNDTHHTAAASVQTDSRAYYPRSSVLDRYRAIPQIMLPEETQPTQIRDYPPLWENEIAPRMEFASQFYGSGRAVPSAADMPSQYGSWASRYESSDRMYADDLRRPVSRRANLSNLPVSSLYSFAGAAPAYR